MQLRLLMLALLAGLAVQQLSQQRLNLTFDSVNDYYTMPMYFGSKVNGLLPLKSAYLIIALQSGLTMVSTPQCLSGCGTQIYNRMKSFSAAPGPGTPFNMTDQIHEDEVVV